MSPKWFVQKLKSMFSSYKLSSEELAFIALNKKVWASTEENKSEGRILVEGFLDSPTSIIEKARLAKAAETVTGMQVIVFVRGLFERSSNVIPIYRSFNIEHFIMWWWIYFSPKNVIFSIRHTFNVIYRVKDGDSLVNYTIKGLLIGDLVYDSLIRNIPNSYTIEKLSLKKHGRLILRSFFFFSANKKMINVLNVRVLVTSHNVYSEYGMLCRQVHSSGGIVLLKDMDVYKLYSQKMNINEHFLKISQNVFKENLNSSDMIKESAYFKSRVLGESEQIDVKNAYVGKKKYSREDTHKLSKSSCPNKKNIIVMAHAFSDAPHVGEGLLFRDYYDFLEKSLIRLNSNTSVNTFVKSHPSSYMWGEKGGVEYIVERNRLGRITILPNDYCTSSIIDSADVIVTAKGTAGIEFSCAGIPAVTAGKGYYYGFGVCIEPESLDDYYFHLDRINGVNKLNQEQIKMARIVLYYSFNNLYHSDILPKVQIRPGDDYASLYRSKFNEVNNNFKSGKLMKDDFYGKVVDDIKKVFIE
ncbi:capsular polysaccharide export protein, LipB/KpsS family [Vibrio campbellii]